MKLSEYRFTGSYYRLCDLLIRDFFFVFVVFMFYIMYPELQDCYILLIVGLVLTLFSILYCLPLLFIQLQRKGNTRQIKRLERDGFSKVEGYPIYFKFPVKDDNDEKLKWYKKLYDSCSKEQREEFEKYGYIIAISNYKVLKGYTRRNCISGLFDKTTKTLYLYTDYVINGNNIVYSPNNIDIRSTFYHEWGHFIDFEYNYLSYTPIILSYYDEELNLHTDATKKLSNGSILRYLKIRPRKRLYELKSPSEFFAVKYSKVRIGVEVDKNLKEYMQNFV